MTLYITAQLIGFIGYILLITAPQFSKQSTIMLVSIFAASLLCLQWALLEQYSLVMTNALIIITTICALKVTEKKAKQQILKLIYVFGCCALLSISQATIIDILALIAFSFMIASRASENIRDFRLLSTALGITLFCSSALALSPMAAIFNAAFACSNIYKLQKLHNQNTVKTA